MPDTNAKGDRMGATERAKINAAYAGRLSGECANLREEVERHSQWLNDAHADIDRLEAEVARLREALTLVQAVAYDDKGDYLNRVRLVVDTALGPRRNAFENAPSGNPAPDGFEVERAEAAEDEVERLRALIFAVVDGEGEDHYTAIAALRRYARETRPDA